LLVRRLSDRYLIQMPGWLDGDLSLDGSSLRAHFPAGASAESREATLRQIIGPLVAHATGRLVLHAAGVVLDEGAVAFAGDSARGKSTLAALFHEAGRSVLADDALPLEVSLEENTASVVHPIVAVASVARVAKLRKPTADALSRPLQPDPIGDRQVLPLFPAPDSPLRAVFMLGDDGPLEFTPLSKQQALLGLVRACHRVDPRDRSLLRRELAQLERVVRDIPVFTLQYPRRFDASAALLAAIEAQVRRLATTPPR
jgi:hypothetical protein